MKKPFSYRMSSADELELSIVGTIGEGCDEEFVSASAVRKALNEGKNAKKIKVNVDSSGGSFFDGLAICQLLQEHPATVDGFVGARAASAATVVLMGCDTVTMHETSTFLVHPVWTVALGNAAELRKVADDLDMLSESSVTAYAAKTGMAPEAIRALMAEDRYMSADEALKLGFCTSIKKAKTKTKALSEQEVRSEVAAIRAKATSRAAALRVAAMAPTIETELPPVPSAPEANSKEQSMNSALFVAALGLPEGASESDIMASLNQFKAHKDSEAKLLASIGAQSADEAIGRIEALKGADERAKAAEAELGDIREASRKEKHLALVASALDPNSSSPHAGKLTPAQKVWAEGVST